MRILLLGSGGREHALARALTAEPNDVELFCAPGNPGIAQHAQLIDISAEDGAAVTQWASTHQVDLVVIGPEAPLVAAVADQVRAAGIAVFGPSAQAARLESSKAFAKEIMAAAGVDTARAYPCRSRAEVQAALAKFAPPYVVKNDGLAAGKGVVVTQDLQAALAHADACLASEGGAVLVEEYLDGPEVSLFCLSDGQTVVPLAPAQDFKRAYDGDTGPNTGGMGAYSPLPWLETGFSQQVVERVAQPVVDEMRRRGTAFVGLLYCGLACTRQGIRVVEFNARFGDPETQAVLARLRTPLAPLLNAAATGTLSQVGPLQWDEQVAITVVMAAAGYPATPRTGDPIAGAERAEAVEGVHVIVAGAKRRQPTVSGVKTDEKSDAPETGRPAHKEHRLAPREAGEQTGKLIAAHADTGKNAASALSNLESSGGRVLNVVAMGEDFAQARQRAYRALEHITLPGAHWRSDIAARAQENTR